MKKTKHYWDVRLIPEAIQEVENQVIANHSPSANELHRFVVGVGDESWEFDSFDEYLAEYPKATRSTYSREGKSDFEIAVYLMRKPDGWFTMVSVTAKERNTIQTIFNIIEKYRERSQVHLQAPAKAQKSKIFIGHGHSQQWRDLKDHLHDKHGYEVVAFEVGERAGHHIRDILEEMLHKSAIAFLVFTGEDETTDGKLHVRQNVVHEAGLFQGRLGFTRAIIIREDDAEDFSNIAGIQQIRFSKGNVKETFGDVLAVLKREFGSKSDPH